MRLVVSLFVVFGVLSIGAGVRAQERATSLMWTRGAGAERCIDEGALQRVVEMRVGRSVFSEDAALLVRGSIARESGRFQVELELVYQGQRIGLRTLESERARCRTLDDSLAVIVALLVESSDAMIADAAPIPVAHAMPIAERHAIVELHVPEDPVVDAEAEPETATPIAMSIGLGGWGTVDTLPSPSLGPAGFIELSFAPWSIRVEGAYLPDQSAALSDSRAALLGFAWCALAVGYDAWITSYLNIGGFVHGRAGILTGTGLGFEDPARGSIPWLALGAGGRTRVRIVGPLAVELDLGFDVSLLRQRFVVESGGETLVVHSLPAIAPFAALHVLVIAE